MQKTSQKEAVFTAITNVLAESNMTIVEGTAVTLSKEHRTQVNAILFEGFKSGSISLDKSNPTDAELKNYVSGVTSNWLRKDKRLNGNVGYIAKNPGSRAGSGDPQLKAMRALLSTLSTEEEKIEVQGYIDARVSEIQKSKVKSVSIDYSALPASLASKFQK